MSNNRNNIIFVAKKLKHLKDEVVFVGGSVVELHLDKGYPLEPRISLDVDAVIEMASRIDYAKFEESLRVLGFVNDQNLICRWTIDGVIVDVMPTDESILGFNNRWYQELYQNSIDYPIEPTLNIRLVPTSYLLATKLEAFKDRGNSDYYGSHDLEDVVTLLDGRESLLEEIRGGGKELREYLKVSAKELMDNAKFVSSLSGHLTPYRAGVSRRVNRIKALLIEISQM